MLGLFEERADRHHARVVDQHVDVAVAVGAGLAEEGGERFVIGDVEWVARNLPECAEPDDCRLLQRHLAVADDDASAAREKRFGGGISDAPSCAGDGDGLTADVVHAAELYTCQVLGGSPKSSERPAARRDLPGLRPVMPVLSLDDVGSRRAEQEQMVENGGGVGRPVHRGQLGAAPATGAPAHRLESRCA